MFLYNIAMNQPNVALLNLYFMSFDMTTVCCYVTVACSALKANTLAYTLRYRAVELAWS